jgi:hypothetical protein
LVCVTVLALGADPPSSPSVPDAARVYVDGAADGHYQNGSERYPFATIQQGIDAAQYDGTVEVARGNYDVFVIDHPVRLKGVGIDSVRVYLADAPCRIENADGARIWGVTVIPPGDMTEPVGTGLEIAASRNVVVAASKFPYFATAIALDDASAVVSGNILEYSGAAVGLARSSGAWIYGNIAANNEMDLACDDSDCRYEESGNAFRPGGLKAGETCTRGTP